MSTNDLNDDLNPLITHEGRSLLNSLAQSPYAPRFNHTAGDRIQKEDLEPLENLRQTLAKPPSRQPSTELLERIERWLQLVPLYRNTIASKGGLKQAWQDLPTISRKEIAMHPEQLVPDDEKLERLIVYRTAGTTGHPLLVPHHPRAAASYQILLESALKRCGVNPRFESGRTACFLIGAQKSTVTYPTVLTVWNQAGFVKLNLNPDEWRDPSHRKAYFEEFKPEILTGDPISFAELATLEIQHRPKALISTAVAMSPSLKMQLEKRFQAPVIDWYSLTETGPIGFFMPGDDGYSILPTDLFVEVIDENGRQLREGEVGEITVSGGRNPFVPLIRYRTGDFGCRVGNKLMALEGRKPVVFRTPKGKTINPVDIARVLREYPIVQHLFKQKADFACDVELRPFASGKPFETKRLSDELSSLFDGANIKVRLNPELGDRSPGGKVVPYESEAKYEE